MIFIPRAMPSNAILAVAGQILATIRVEIIMQWRRWGLWLTFACYTAVMLLLTVQSAIYMAHLPPKSTYVLLHFTPTEINYLIIYSTTTYGAMFIGIVAALLVVDRLGRDQQLRIFELQRAAPQGYASYVLGKFLGNYIAILLPTFLSYLLCALVPLLFGWPVTLLPMYLLVFLLIFIPSSLAAVGLTFLLVSVLPVRVVQIIFVVIWFYFDIGIGWHGLAETIFNPSGPYVYLTFFPLRLPNILNTTHASLEMAWLNISALLLTAIVTLVLTCQGPHVIQTWACFGKPTPDQTWPRKRLRYERNRYVRVRG